MIAIVEPQVSPSASAEQEARAGLLKLTSCRWSVTQAVNYGTFNGCCGSAALKAGGMSASYVGAFGDRLPLKNLDAWEEIGRARSPYDMYARHLTKEQWEANYIRPWRNYSPANKPGVFLGVGLSRDKLIEEAFDPSNELYRVLEGIEIDDPDDGLCSIIWTNV